jgi:YegS/Rv2252/BmrU family lipid kinase
MTMHAASHVLVLINPDSGPDDNHVAEAIDGIRKAWEVPGTALKFQFTSSGDDGHRKAKAALDAGIDTILAVGGDGVVNSLGTAMMGSPARLGVIPAGSGNGFARHFGIPLGPHEAATRLKRGRVLQIDVGRVNQTPFIVTASFAWEVDVLTEYVARSVRGILPYVFAAVHGAFTHTPQAVVLTVDDAERICIKNPLLCTVANLTQYGGGMKIAPSAQPDDGRLELVYMQRDEFPNLINRLPDVIDGKADSIPELNTRSFSKLRVKRNESAAIQLDGELIEADAILDIDVVPVGLRILIPGTHG